MSTALLELHLEEGAQVVGEIVDLVAFRVSGLAGLYGDGQMEIVVGSQYYAGTTTIVDEYVDNDREPQAALATGCGL